MGAAQRGLIVLVLAASAASADDEPPLDMLESLHQMVDAHHCGDAYPQIMSMQQMFPRSSYLDYLAATCAIKLVRRDQARAELDRGLAADPGDPRLLGKSSELRFMMNDTDGARADAEQSLAREPSNREAAATLANLDLVAQAIDRRGTQGSKLAVGTPRWFVDHFLERVFAGAEGPELSAYFDPEIMQSMPPEQRTRGQLIDYMRGVHDTVVQRIASGDQQYLGWVIGDVTPSDGDRVWVDVKMPSVDVFTAELADRDARMYKDPNLRAQLPAVTTTWLGEVNDLDRPALLKRMIGVSTLGITTARLELVPNGIGYRIDALVMSGVDVNKLFAAERQDSAAAPNARPPRWLLAGIAAFLLVVIGVGGGFALSALRGPARARRRR